MADLFAVDPRGEFGTSKSLGYSYFGKKPRPNNMERWMGGESAKWGSWIQTSEEGVRYDMDTGEYRRFDVTPTEDTPAAPAAPAAAPKATVSAPKAIPRPLPAAPTIKAPVTDPTVTKPGLALEPIVEDKIYNTRIGSAIGGNQGQTRGEMGDSPFDYEARGLKGLTTATKKTRDKTKEIDRKRFGQGLFNIGLTNPGSGTGIQI